MVLRFESELNLRTRFVLKLFILGKKSLWLEFVLQLKSFRSFQDYKAQQAFYSQVGKALVDFTIAYIIGF